MYNSDGVDVYFLNNTHSGMAMKVDNLLLRLASYTNLTIGQPKRQAAV
jgi:hypothetical protein